jgi:hypothetical protein
MGIHDHRSGLDRAIKLTLSRPAEGMTFWLGVVMFWLLTLITVALLDQSLRWSSFS